MNKALYERLPHADRFADNPNVIAYKKQLEDAYNPERQQGYAMAPPRRKKQEIIDQLAALPPNLSPEAQRMVAAEIPEEMFRRGEPKRFRDYQPEGMLKGTMFDYVPDPVQTSRFLMDRLGRRRPNIEEVDMATLPRRKLMEPNR